MNEIYCITGTIMFIFTSIFTAFKAPFEGAFRPKTPNSRLLSYFPFFDAFKKPNSPVPSEFYNDDFFKQSSKFPIGTLKDPLAKDYDKALQSANDKINRLRNEILEKSPSTENNQSENKRKIKSSSGGSVSVPTSLNGVVNLLTTTNIYSIFPVSRLRGSAANVLRTISEEIFDPESRHGLFRFGTDMKSQINSLESDSEINLRRMRLFGVIIARLALSEQVNADVSVESPFYAMLLDKPVTLDVINGADKILKSNLEGMVFKDGVDYQLTFSIDEENQNGKMVNYPISKDFSADEEVTQENKIKYVKALIDFKFVTRVKAKMEAFKEGFYSIISKERLIKHGLDVDEVEMMITGSTTIDVKKLKARTVVIPPRLSTSKTMNYFWEILNEMNEREKRLFLRFISKRSDQIPQEILVYICEEYPTRKLPIALTCEKMIRMPDYKDKALMKTKILQAIGYTSTSNDKSKQAPW